MAEVYTLEMDGCMFDPASYPSYQTLNEWKPNILT